jgi:hypothetical protein
MGGWRSQGLCNQNDDLEDKLVSPAINSPVACDQRLPRGPHREVIHHHPILGGERHWEKTGQHTWSVHTWEHYTAQIISEGVRSKQTTQNDRRGDIRLIWIHTQLRSLRSNCMSIRRAAVRSVTSAGCWWPMLVILATQEAEIRRISVRSQPGRMVLKTLSGKPFT